MIVLGVLIALAADEAMRSSNDRELAADLVERLIQDIRQDSVLLEQFLPQTGAAYRAGARLIMELEGGPPVPDDSLAAVVRAFSIRPVFPLIRRSTYVELISTGGLGLIPEAKRVQVVEYYEQVEWLERTMPGGGSSGTPPWWTDLPPDFYFDTTFEMPSSALRSSVLGTASALEDMRSHSTQHRVFSILNEQMLTSASDMLAALAANPS